MSRKAQSKPMHGNVLLEAHTLINKDRASDYGDSYICHDNIAKLWSAYLDKDLTPKDVCIMMVLLKLGREKLVHKDDNLVDMAGYVGLASDMQKHLDSVPVEKSMHGDSETHESGGGLINVDD